MIYLILNITLYNCKNLVQAWLSEEKRKLFYHEKNYHEKRYIQVETCNALRALDIKKLENTWKSWKV